MKKNDSLFFFKSPILMLFFMLMASLVFAEDNAATAVIKENPNKPTSSDRQDKSYQLQIGDHIHMKIYPEDEYFKDSDMEISSEGNITLPLVGKVEVAGKTIIEAEKILAKLLDADYLVNPEVVIRVQDYKKQSIVILGQVRKPGTYEFPPGESKMSLLQAVSLAGGFSEVANIKKIKIVRRAEGENRVIRANAENIISGKEADIPLNPGDVISVSESLF